MWHSGKNLYEELIHWLLLCCACWQQHSSSPTLHHRPFGGALSSCHCPAATAFSATICITSRAPCLWGAPRVCVHPWQTVTQLPGQALDNWSPNSCRSLRVEIHQKVCGGRASNCFDCCVTLRWDGDSCVHIGLRLILILFQQEVGVWTGDAGAQRRVGVVGGWGRQGRAAALGWETGAAWRGAAAAPWAQALCSSSSSSSIKLVQERVTARSVAWKQPEMHQAVSQKWVTLICNIIYSNVIQQGNYTVWLIWEVCELKV